MLWWTTDRTNSEGTTMPRMNLALCVISYLVLAAIAVPATARTFTTLDFPGAIHTEAYGMDLAGDIVGFYVDTNNVNHGFKETGAEFTTIDFPSATGTQVFGIDLDGIKIVGTYTDPGLVCHGFVLASNTFTTVDVPSAVSTRAFSVNSLGTVVGSYTDSAGKVHGFLDQNGNGAFTTLDFPKATLTEIHSIANLRYMAGIIIGSQDIEHGVQGANGALVAEVNVPGAALTSADGVNDAIDIVGHFGESAAGPFHGYLLMGGKFRLINFPGATDTRCNGITDGLEILGRYTDAQGVIHGFLAK